MSNLLRHSSCPLCGSRDNLAEWNDGSRHCFTPGCGYHVNSSGDVTQLQREDKPYVPPRHLEDMEDGTRGIKLETFRKYRIAVNPEKGRDGAVWFPYYVDGRLVGGKYRDIDRWEHKAFWWEGNNAGLFGMQSADTGREGIIVTEGEFDAVAAYQMHGFKYPCVSLAHGAEGAKRDISKHMTWLDQFKTIFINFDMDEPGQRAADEVMPLFKAGKAKRVTLPTPFKDANEMLQAGEEQLYRKCISEAQAILPPGFCTKEQLISKVLDELDNIDKYKGITTGFKGLDRIMGGLRGGEVIVCVGGTKRGKTGVTRAVAFNAMKLGNMKTLWFPLEMRDTRVLMQFASMDLQRKVDLDLPLPLPRAELFGSLDWMLNNLVIYNWMGSLTIEGLCDAIIHAALVQDVKLVVLDHKDAVVNYGSEQSYKDIDRLMGELNRVANQYNLCIWVVSHQSRDAGGDDNKLSLGKIRGSQGVAQYASQVWGVRRHFESTVAEVVALTPHRYTDRTGTVYLDFDLYTRNYTELDEKTATEKIKFQLKANAGKDILADEEEEYQETYEGYPSQTRTNNTEEEETTPESVREGYTVKLPECGVRTDSDSVHLDFELHSRLENFVQVRQDYLCGIERTPESTGLTEVQGNQGTASLDELAICIRASRQAGTSTSPDDLRRVG